VLYGTLLSDRWLTLSAMAIVLGIYAWTLLAFWPLPRLEFFYITNLALLTLVLGLCSSLVLYMHHLLLLQVAKQSHNLKEELGLSHKLMSVIHHDIGDRVHGLDENLQQLKARLKNPVETEEIEQLVKNVGRIKETIHGLEDLAERNRGKHTLRAIRGEEIAFTLEENFRDELEAGRQSLSLLEGADVEMQIRGDLLTNLVLFNLMRHAMHSSPRGATLLLRVRTENQGWRITLSDEGSGMSGDLMAYLEDDRATLAPDAEELGQGLRLAKFYTHRMGGQLEFKQAPGGGSEARIWLPQPVST
jgi:signal transduction histidine kinase